MEIRDPHSLLALFIESFRVTNRAFGRIITFCIISIVGVVLLQLLLFISVPLLCVEILNGVFSAFLAVLLIKIIAAQAEGDLASIWDLMSASLLPAVYMIIFSLLLGIVSLVGNLLTVVILHTFSWIGALILIPIVLFIFARIILAVPAIALRDMGPMHAIAYSWELTSGHVFRMLVALFLSVVFPWLCIAGILYGLYTLIPLYFANSFDILHLSAAWWITFALLAVLVGFVFLSMQSFFILIFLNLDFTEGAETSSQVLQAPQIHDNGTALSTGAAKAAKTTDTPNVQVLKASVKTHTSDDSLDKHLDAVYQPVPQNEIIQTEEDRMPTIVFDDSMAAQIAKERELFEQEKAQAKARHNPEDDGEPTIKMSK